MMSIATAFAMVGLDLIADRRRGNGIAQRVTETGRTVIALDHAQIANFAGNTLELSGQDGRVRALSRRAFDGLTGDPRATIERSARRLPLDAPTIELVGGSVRFGALHARGHSSRATARSSDLAHACRNHRYIGAIAQSAGQPRQIAHGRSRSGRFAHCPLAQRFEIIAARHGT